MTREEVRQWFENLYETVRQSHNISCASCLSPYTIELVAYNDVAKYQRVALLFKQGSIFYVPHYQKCENYSNGLPHVYHTFIGANISIKEVFCGKTCFINYVYDHQTELVELITQ